MVAVFHLALLHIACEAHIMVRRQQQASALALQPFADRRDLLGSRLLLGENMVESENHQRVGVGEDALVDRLFEPGLIDALEHGDGMASRLARDLLKAERGAVEQFQRSGDALEELRRAPFRRLVRWPQNVPDLRHGGEAVLHRRGVSLGFPGVTPCPVDADAALAGRVFSVNVVLVVSAGRGGRRH